jgi:DDE superfamily endonuclease
LQLFLHELGQHDRETLNMVVLDHGSCHQAQSLVIPEQIVCLLVPPYSPELNPIERWWQEVTAQWAWVLAAASDEVAHRVETLLTHDSTAAIRSLTSYPYVVHAVHAVLS